jgi:hypothetical protein
VACAWFKLVVLSSTLNKMSYQGTWCATNDNLDIKYTFQPSAAVSSSSVRCGVAGSNVWSELRLLPIRPLPCCVCLLPLRG